MLATLATTHLTNLLDFAACKGLDRTPLHQLLYSPAIDQADPQSRVSRDEYCLVWEHLLQQSHDAYVGLHYGCFLNLKALGLIYQISLTASSIEQAMTLLTDYLDHTFPLVSLTTRVQADYFVIDLHSDVPNSAVRRQILDSVLFLMYRELSVMIEGPVAEVQLPYETLTEYQRLCPGPVSRSNAYRLWLKLSQVSGPINRRRLQQIETLLPLFLQLFGQLPGTLPPFTGQVRSMTLNLCAPELPTLDQVVAQFAMSHRTFQRKLAEEGASFRGIADTIKRQLSGYLAQGHSLQTQDVAYLLGYSSSSAYLHAARKWR